MKQITSLGANSLGKSTPLVSVVIPAYNASRTLAQTLDSVLAQTYPNIEIIVVDDGSSDATAEVLNAYGERVRNIYQPNKGLPGARNTGCLSARGEFIALMDADDLCVPERIAIQLGVLQNFPEAALCSTDFSAFNSNGLVAHSYGAMYYSTIKNTAGGLHSLYSEHGVVEIAASAWSPPQQTRMIDTYSGTVYRKLVHGNFVHPPTVMFRRRVLEVAGMFDEALRYTCDWEWMVRVARTGPFVYVNHPLLEYRLSEVQMSSWHFNGGKGAVDVVQAAKKIWHSDPDLLSANRHLMRRDLGEFCLDAAEALVNHRKNDAVKMLVQSVWVYYTIKAATVRTTLKILLPRKLLMLTRQFLARLKIKEPAGLWFYLDGVGESVTSAMTSIVI